MREGGIFSIERESVGEPIPVYRVIRKEGRVKKLEQFILKPIGRGISGPFFLVLFILS